MANRYHYPMVLKFNLAGQLPTLTASIYLTREPGKRYRWELLFSRDALRG